MSDAVLVDLEDLDAGGGWILESRIDYKGGAEVAPLLVELLLASILFISLSHGILRSTEITRESRSGGGRESFLELCDWGR